MNDGLIFMIVGMSVVFGFLILMVLVMSIAGSVLKDFAHLFPEEEETKATSRPAAATRKDEAAIAAAIAIARVKSGR